MNSVFVIFIVNWDVRVDWFRLKGYDKFSVEWYEHVGVKIIKIMIILVVLIPVANLSLSCL